MGNVKLSYVHPKEGLRIVLEISLSPTPIPFMVIIRIRNKQPAVDIRAIKSCYPTLLSPRGINPGWNLVIRPNYLSKNGPNCGKLISIENSSKSTTFISYAFDILYRLFYAFLTSRFFSKFIGMAYLMSTDLYTIRCILITSTLKDRWCLQEASMSP